MKTYPIGPPDALRAFEIENVYVTRRGIARFLAREPGISGIRLRGRIFSADDIRLEFKYVGRHYVVWEPYGDNSRYWIGPEDDQDRGDVIEVRGMFERYRPAAWQLREFIIYLLAFRWLRNRR
jgi:hypothetical protein